MGRSQVEYNRRNHNNNGRGSGRGCGRDNSFERRRKQQSLKLNDEEKMKKQQLCSSNVPRENYVVDLDKLSPPNAALYTDKAHYNEKKLECTDTLSTVDIKGEIIEMTHALALRRDDIFESLSGPQYQNFSKVGIYLDLKLLGRLVVEDTNPSSRLLLDSPKSSAESIKDRVDFLKHEIGHALNTYFGFPKETHFVDDKCRTSNVIDSVNTHSTAIGCYGLQEGYRYCDVGSDDFEIESDEEDLDTWLESVI
mmetsp:Transcript_23468/g.53567  ORF Transcript_23468/g.53567 Transcript_23468/m.53567 type:complete len:252 (-) Transcript_23468:109-864(-)